MEMKFYSPLTAEFFPDEPDWEDESYNEYEGYPMDGHDLLQYADAVDEAVKKDIADFNGDLMQYYHEDDSVRGKVVNAVPSVEIHGNKLCGCLTVELKEPLLDDEQTVLCNYISGQYSDGWGEGFEQREIDIGDGDLYVHLWNWDNNWDIKTEEECFGPKVADGLPEMCFSTLLTTGDLICIKRGETGYYPSDWDTGDKEQNVELADQLNEQLGVTMWQRKAMEVGSMCGWDVPGADPAKYLEDYDPHQMGGMTLG